MQTPVSIIIPAFNQLQYCRQCIASVLAHTAYAHKLILVDNASTDGVTEYFDTVEGACVLHAETNLGFAGGVNLGLAHAEGHVLLLNSDTIVPQGWLTRMVQALEQSGDIGLVGPRSNYVSGPQQIDGLDLTSVDDINAFARDLAAKHAGQLTETPRLVGFCLLIRDKTFQEVGALDERFGIGNYEDDDYCLRVRKAGYRLCIAEDAFVFHYGGRTFLGMGLSGDGWKDLMEANSRRFAEKWATEPMARYDAAQQSQQYNEQARQALESGDAPQAIRLLKSAIETFPLLARNYNDLGAVLWQLGERERALEQFARAVRIEPDFAEGRANLADAAEALGKTDEYEALLHPKGQPNAD